MFFESADVSFPIDMKIRSSAAIMYFLPVWSSYLNLAAFAASSSAVFAPVAAVLVACMVASAAPDPLVANCVAAAAAAAAATEDAVCSSPKFLKGGTTLGGRTS